MLSTGICAMKKNCIPVSKHFERQENIMPYSEYWNPKNETLPREELQALQLLKLQRLCQWAYATTPFHRRKFDAAGFKPEQLKTLDDLRRIPFMTREEWMESLLEKPLFEGLVASDAWNAVSFYIHSCTTARCNISNNDGV